MVDHDSEPVEVEAGTIQTLPSGDVIIGAPTAVALATPPDNEEND